MGYGARYWLLCLALGFPAALPATPLQVRVVDHQGGGVAGVVVYLEPREPAAMPSPADGPPLEIAQDERRFAPYVGVIRAGQPVLFTNHDDITHHVYSFNGPARFSFHIRPGEENRLDEFDTAGVIAMGCNIHDWMSGYLLVLDTPYHGRTEAGGQARLEAPAGEYRLTAWHPQMREEESLDTVVSLPSGGAVELRLTRPMAEIPRQEGLDDFDFLERY